MLKFPLGGQQLSGLEIYVLDPVHDEYAQEMGEPVFAGTVEARTLWVPDDALDMVWRTILDAANSADVNNDRDSCEALSRLGHRLTKELSRRKKGLSAK